MLVKPVVVAVTLLCAMVSRPAIAAPQDIGKISCDVVLDYVGTSPAYIDIFRSYLDGYLASEHRAGKTGADPTDVAKLMSKVVEFCASSRDATLETAVVASVK